MNSELDKEAIAPLGGFNYVLNFGKFKGQLLGNVPSDYLQWMFENKVRTFGYWAWELLRRQDPTAQAPSPQDGEPIPTVNINPRSETPLPSEGNNFNHLPFDRRRDLQETLKGVGIIAYPTSPVITSLVVRYFGSFLKSPKRPASFEAYLGESLSEFISYRSTKVEVFQNLEGKDLEITLSSGEVFYVQFHGNQNPIIVDYSAP